MESLPTAPTRDAAAGSSGGGNGGMAGSGNPDLSGGNAGNSGSSGDSPDASGGSAGNGGVAFDSGSGGSSPGTGGSSGSNDGGSGGSSGSGTSDAGPGRDAATEGASPAGDSGGAVINLFNGTDLTGWEISTVWPDKLSPKPPPLTADQAQKVFKVENGTIHDYADAVDGSDQVRATLTTTASYSNYRLTLDYKWGTKKFSPYNTAAYPKDAGILFHVSGNRKKVWPDSAEFQIKENETGDLYALGIKVTSWAKSGGTTFVDALNGGTTKVIDGSGGNAPHRHLVGSFEVPEWNTVEMTVMGDGAVYVVNGHMVNKVSKIQDNAGNSVTSGPIVLQAEHAEVFYRNVRLQVLK